MDSKQLNQIKSGRTALSTEQILRIFPEILEYALEITGKYELTVRMQEQMAAEYKRQQEVNVLLTKDIDQLEKTVEHLTGLVGRKNRELYGPSSEKRVHSPKKTDKTDENPNPEPAVEKDEMEESKNPEPEKEPAVREDQEKEAPKEPRRRKKYTPRAEKLDSLALLTIYGWDVERINAIYGNNWDLMGWEIHTQIECIPAFTYKKETMVPVIAVGPERKLVRLPFEGCVIPRSELSASLAASLIDEKYRWHVPINRMADRLRSGGLVISRQNLAGKMDMAIERFLAPVADHIRQELLEKDHLQADETPVEVLGNNEKESHKGYLWTYTSSEVAEDDHKIAVFSFDWSRSGSVAEEFLNLAELQKEDRLITLTHDGYSGYRRLEKEYAQTLKGSCCLTHFRRRWLAAYEVLEGENSEKDLSQTIEYKVMDLIGEIYSFDTPSKRMTKEERLTIRQEKIRPLMEKMFALIEKEAKKMEKNPAGYGESLKNAITYSVNQKKELFVFLDDPEVPIDNSLAERCIRPIKLGCRNWNFFGSDNGAANAAICYTLVETARMNGADTRIYLQYVIERMVKINDMEISEVKEKKLMEELMPWSDQYKEYERLKKYHFPPLDKLVFPNQNQSEIDSYFPKLITEKPEMRKKYRARITEADGQRADQII